MTQRRSRSTLRKQKLLTGSSKDSNIRDKLGTSVENVKTRFKNKRRSENIKALSKGVEGMALGKVAKGRSSPERTIGITDQTLRVSPSLKGPFKPVRALNLNRPGYGQDYKMTINEFDRQQEGCQKDFHAQYYTNQQTVQQYLDRALPLQQRQDKRFPAGPVFNKNSERKSVDSNIPQFLPGSTITHTQEHAKIRETKTKLQKLQALTHRCSPFTPQLVNAPLPLEQSTTHRPVGKLAARRLSSQPSSQQITTNQMVIQVHANVRQRLQHEQDSIERRLINLSEIPVLEDLPNGERHSRPSNNIQMRHRSLTPAIERPNYKKFQPIQISAAQPMSRIPVHMKFTAIQNTKKMHENVCDRVPDSDQLRQLQPKVVNMPILVNFESKNCQPIQQAPRLKSAVSNRKKSKTQTSLTRGNKPSGEALQIQKAQKEPPQTSQATVELDPFASLKISTQFRAKNNVLFKTLGTPTQVNKENTSSRLGNDSLQTRRLDSLIQLIEKDLDKQKRSMQSPTSQVSPMTTRTAVAAAKEELLPYVGLSKRNMQTNSNVKANQLEQLQHDTLKISTKTAMPILIEKIQAKPFIPLSLVCLEAFRLRLFEFALEQPFENVEPVEISDVLAQRGIGESLLFTFLTFIHVNGEHQGYNKPIRDKNTSLKRVSSLHVLSRKPSHQQLQVVSKVPSSRSLTVRPTQQSERDQDEKFNIGESMDSMYDNNYQQQIKLQLEEEKMLSNDAQKVVGGVSYLNNQQQRSLPSASDGQQREDRLATSGEHVRGQLADGKYTPRGIQVDRKMGKFSSKTKFGNNNPKKEIRVSQRGTITASNGGGAEKSSSRKNHFTTDKITKVGSAHGRNNGLSNSLQILHVPTGTMEQRNLSVGMNSFAKVSNSGQTQSSQHEKSVHLRYISQSMHRSNSIEEDQPHSNYLNKRQSLTGAAPSRRVNITQKQRENVVMLPSRKTSDRVNTQEQRLGVGVLQNNVETEDHMQSSLHVQSNNSSSIVFDGPCANKGQPQGGTVTFTTSEYGVMKSNQDHLHTQGDYDVTQSNQLKNVPLMVNQRRSVIPSDYLSSNIIQDGNPLTTPIIKGVCGINLGEPNVSSQQNSLKQIPNNKTENKMILSSSQRPQGRGDKLTNNSQKQKNQSFQQILQEGQKTATFKQHSLERALKTAQMGVSHRTRGSELDPNLSIWDAPLSQKLDFTSKADSLGHPQTRDGFSTSTKTREQLILLHSVTPGQGRKPDFRQSTALPRSYKQFVATVNSGLLQTTNSRPQAASSTQPGSSDQLYKTATGGFTGVDSEIKSGVSRPSGSSNRRQQCVGGKRKKKDHMLKMINQLEMGDNSDTFRNLAKQFYSQNLQIKSTATGPVQTGSNKKSALVSIDGSKKDLTEKQQQIKDDQEQILLQKQLWQQFQLLRILKQTKYQHQLEKQQNRGEAQLPKSGPPGSQALEYGFDMTEEEMYKMLFIQPSGQGFKVSARKNDKSKSNDQEENQPYASFDCPECVQMASLMLQEELRYYQSRQHGKRKGKSRDAMLRGAQVNINKGANGQPLKGIAGLQTQGVSLKNQKMSDDEQLMFFRDLQDVTHGKGQKRQRGQTQQILVGKRIQSGYDDPKIVGQIVVSRGQAQVVFKKQLNQNFRQVVRGEQMTQHMKVSQPGGLCTCRSGPYQPSSRGGKVCVCGANNTIATVQPLQRNLYETPAIPSMGYHHGSQRMHKGKRNSQFANHKGIGHSGQEGGAHHGNGPSKNLADGTVQGGKRKYKPANGIYQPPLQPFKHLAQSPINQVFNKINELVLILFKQKIKSSDQQIIKLFKYFGIPVPRGNGVVLDTKTIRMPDFQHTVNQKLLIKLYKVLNHENGDIQPEQSTQIFRFYVGKGNNYAGVRQIISRRTWWNRGNQRQEKFYGQKGCYDEDFSLNCTTNVVANSLDDQQLTSKQFSSGCHFIWTQWRKTEHHEFLKRVKQDKMKLQQLANSNNKKDHKMQSKGKSVKSPRTPVVFNKLQSQVAPLANVPTLIYNRLDDNYHLSNKKALFLNVSMYYRAMGINPFEVAIPLTFNVKAPHNGDAEYSKFSRAYKQFQQQKDANIWIIKPGENSNRGTGIQVASTFGDIRNIIQQLSSKNGNRTSIVQKYLDKPLLIHNRKFDIRGYALLTSINGKLKGYMYRDCYFRTSSKQFDLTNLNSRFIHLTNDAIQINSEDYGKFESGNKLSINDFQRYLDGNHSSKNVCFMRDLFPQMERLVTDSFRAVGSRIDPRRLANCFEIFGYDFMIDENFKVFLIEANTNPSLEICSPLLARIIPELLDNSFRVAVDPLYQPAQFLAKLQNDGVDESQTTKTGGVVGAAAEGGEGFQHSPKLNCPATRRTRDVGSSGAAAQPIHGSAANQGPQKRQRLELLTQIKYTLVYDERIDRPVVDKILAEYEMKLRQVSQEPLAASAQPKEGPISTPSPPSTAAGTGEGVQPAFTANENDHERLLFREIVEEEKLDEQAAIKEEIEASENEEAGIMPQPLMLRPIVSNGNSEDEDEDDIESDDFN